MDLLPLFFALSPKFLSLVSRTPFDSISSRSLDSPQPISIAAFAPSESTLSISVESKITPPLLVAPAGIESANFLANDLGLMSLYSISRAHNRTPQLMSNPTPPGEIAPP